MTETNADAGQAPHQARWRRRCLVLGGLILFLLLLLLIILILALTVFKPKQPRTQLLSATLDGIAPRISFPVIDIQFNITIDLKLLVHNPNHASFKHGPGKSFLSYRGNHVGEADISSGLIPSMGTEIFPCRLVIELDKIASNAKPLIADVLEGQLVLETLTRVPGRVIFLGLFKKHAVATCECQFTIISPAMKIQSQECKSNTKF